MPTKSVIIPDIGSVTLRKSRRNKFIRLSINHDGLVKITMPPWVPYRVGVEFAKTKKSWIRDRAPRPVVIHHGDGIGKTHIVEFVQSSGDNVRSTVNNSHIRVHIPKKIDSINKKVQTSAQKAAHKALRKQAEDLLPERVQQLALQHDFDYAAVSTKKLKSRWGSCNEKKELVFNYYLLQLPWEYIDYVILHELTHTRVLSHNAQFWSELTSVLPRSAYYRSAIKQFRPVLMPQATEESL